MYRQVVSFRPIKNSIPGAGFGGPAPGLKISALRARP